MNINQKREFHYINPNHNKEIPHHIILVDTETNINKLDSDNQTQTFRLGFAIYLRWNNDTKSWIENEYKLYYVEDFHRLLDKIILDKRKVYIFAHNSAFDYTVLKMDSYISSRNYEIVMRVIDSVFLIKAFKKDLNSHQSFVFGDTMNYYRTSLEKLGEIFGEKKMKKPDFNDVSDIDLMRYCRQDVRVLSTLIKKHIAFIQEHNLGNFKLTIASQSFTAFTHRFMNEKILIHNCNDVIELELQSYRGGRCEAFRLGKYNSIYKLDVNSMYPFVMKNYKYPTILLPRSCCNKDLPLNELYELIDEDIGILANCNFELKEPAIAVKKDKLLFPIGKINQTLTSPELKFILDNPSIAKLVKINKFVTYHQCKIFSDYVDYFYNLKISSTNEAYRQMSKLFLNSLYGKFGQKSVEIQEQIDNKEMKELYFEIMSECNTFILYDKDRNGDTIKYIKLGSDLYAIYQSDDILANDSSPIIASTVTAYSRLYLFSLMKIAGLENVLYCDTDSLFVNEEGYNNLKLSGYISKDILGKLKLEDFGNVNIMGAKNYTFNDEVKLKGIKKDAELVDIDTYKQSQFMTKNMKYRNGIEDGIVMVKPIIKKISKEYDKGVVNIETGKINPILFKDFE